MGRNAIQAIGFVLSGMVLMGLIVWFTMPSLMLVKCRSTLGYDETVMKLGEEVRQKPDWKVLVVNDYRKATEAFGSIERTGSINICNPRYASRILANDSDRGVTAMMPLAIGVYEDKQGQVYISRMNFKLVGMMFGGTIAEVMGTAGKDVGDIVKSVAVE